MTTAYDYGYQAPSTSAPAYQYGAASSSVPSVTTTVLMAMDAVAAGSPSPTATGALAPLASRLAAAAHAMDAGAPPGGSPGAPCHWGDVALALALSCGAGVRATLPAFLLSCCHLMDPEEYTLSGYARFLQLGRPEVCAALGALLALEIAADHMPSVDHALHTVLLPIHPLMGAFAAIAPGYCGGWYARVPMAVVGGALALGVHSGKALVRVGVGSACCGMLSPLVSHCETLLVSALMLLSVTYPEAALVTDVLFIYLGYLGVSGSGFLLRSAYKHLAALKASDKALSGFSVSPTVPPRPTPRMSLQELPAGPPRELPEELKGLQVHGPTTVGWDVNCLPNETMDGNGRLPPPNNRGFGQMDQSPLCPKRRDPKDPSVQALREHLREHNGIKGLEICEPHELDRARRIFHRDGFVVVKDCLNQEQLGQWRAACAEALTDILAYPGPEGRKYITESGRLPHRYSFGTASASRHMCHHPVWASMIDLPTTTPIIEKIFGPDYALIGCGGDLCLPGAIEYQHLHRDTHPRGEGPVRGQAFGRRVQQAQALGMDLHGRKPEELSLNQNRLISEHMPASGTINFLMVDSTWENGPIRQIPGSHAMVSYPPSSADEPEWMRLSTLVGAPAGSGIFRDHRAWHGATPNLSDEIRCMPNIEWVAAWAAGPGIPKTMPHEVWETLTPHGKHVCRFVHAPPGRWPPGAGVMHPIASVRLAAFERMGGNGSNDELGGQELRWKDEKKKRAEEERKKSAGQYPTVVATRAKL